RRAAAHDEALVLEHSECLTKGGTRDPELVTRLVLGGQPLPLRDPAIVNARADPVGDLDVQRARRAPVEGHQCAQAGGLVKTHLVHFLLVAAPSTPTVVQASPSSSALISVCPSSSLNRHRGMDLLRATNIAAQE